ncbi:fibroblast growth factor receptor substrate 3 [Bacillus rossius redtenbacheri]|uniref:fibroblast growth factor receptor substrate 3 n=1 Tax=Bacillus rossius redtenbacheri TaxID=93214 RepID=UPI002FDDBDF7
MGCISSKTDINDLHPNIFQVMNVDDLGNKLSPGQLEITETDLVLYQRKKAPVKWPLRCLRRYGFDAELFSFESGRRCPTGPGIYAFRCQRAEQLFNLLQTHIQVRNSTGEESWGPAVPARVGVDANYLEPSSVRPALRGARLSSVGSSSNGPVSPQDTTSPSPSLLVPSVSPPAPAEEAPESCSPGSDRRASLKQSLGAGEGPGDPRDAAPPASPSYINVELSSDARSPTLGQGAEPCQPCPVPGEARQSPVYMNVFPGAAAAPQDWEPRHCYENLGPGEMEVLKHLPGAPPLPPPPPPPPLREVNYAVLDLNGVKPPVPEGPPESPKKASAGYATIDFDRTVALLQSVQPSVDNDSEGSRKTRHNSTIGDALPPPHTRHSSSD